MPSLVTTALPVLAGAMLTAVLANPAGASTPPDDSQEALDRFAVIADGRGYDLIDPVCEARDGEAGDYLCFARVGPDPGDLFVIRNNTSSTIIDYTVVAEPPADTPGSDTPRTDQPGTDQPGSDQPGDAEAPANGPPRGAELASFDAFSYFIAMFSGDPKAFVPLEPVTAPGSAADAYLTFQREATETAAELDIEVPAAPVYLTPSGPRMCPSADIPCSDFTDIVVSGGLVESFAVGGNLIAPRLGVPGEPTAVGDTTFTVVASYRTVSTDALVIYLEIESTSPVVLDLLTATYLNRAGGQTPVDPDQSIGAVVLPTSAERLTLMLAFDGADPGGTLRFSIFPENATTAFAAHITVPALLTEPTVDDG